MPLSSQKARAIVDIRYARKSGDPDRLQDAQRDLAAVSISEYVTRVVAAAPPLTEDQRARIAAILRPSAKPVAR